MAEKISLDQLCARYTQGTRTFSDVKIIGGARSGLQQVHLYQAVLTNVDFEGAMLEGATFANAQLIDVRVVNAKLMHCDFSGSVARGIDFSGAKIQGASFDKADLTGALFRGVQVDGDTSFQDALVDRCVMARHTIESLKNYGGLSTGQRMKMRIEDGVAEMRANYSGFWQWVHLLALILFLSPYLFFLAREYVVARFNCTEGCSTVARQLWRYLYTGGRFDDHLALVPFAIFWFSLAYNLLRLVLLLKTKHLELTQQASSLPADFDLVGGWRKALDCAHYGFAINFILVLVHTWHFLQMQVPVR